MSRLGRGLAAAAFVLWGAVPGSLWAEDSKGSLTVVVTGAKSDSGLVRLTLFSSAAGFPSQGDKAARTASVPLKGGMARATFDGLAPGDYAVAVLHDENANGQLDTGLFGIPKEGFGSSNNTRRLGPPSFEDAAFPVKGPSTRVQITLRHLSM